MKLSEKTLALFHKLINGALVTGLIPRPYPADSLNFRRRAMRALYRNLSTSGDCAQDLPLLCGLAIAEAHIGQRPGWIPEVQRIACDIANLLSH